jgi:hypothetical protein
MTDWMDLSRRAAFASHRLIGWIYWDPTATANYAALGVPDGIGYYFATRGASLGDAGNDVVTAAFGSINADFVAGSLDLCRQHTTFAAAAAARDAAVVPGLRDMTPQICDDLADLAPDLWAAADGLPLSGRVFFASLRQWPRPEDQLLSAWSAVNCIREWRGDTHWAIHAAEDVDGNMAMLLDAAWRGHDDEWLPRSRGADDAAVADGLAELEARGLADGGRVNEAGVAFRQELEDRLDRIASAAWRLLGEERTTAFLALLEPVDHVYLERIDQTAGPRWMPEARERVVRP